MTDFFGHRPVEILEDHSVGKLRYTQEEGDTLGPNYHRSHIQMWLPLSCIMDQCKDQVMQRYEEELCQFNRCWNDVEFVEEDLLERRNVLVATV